MKNWPFYLNNLTLDHNHCQRPTALNIGPGKFGHDGDDDDGDDDDEHDDGGDDDQFICQIRQKLNSLTSESLSVPKACEVTVSV